MPQPTKTMTGKLLNEVWGVGAKHALYHEEGKWFHQLKDFPGALFDANGYIVFKTKDEYLKCKYLQINQDLFAPSGITSIPGYIRVTEQNQIQAFSQQIREVSQNQSLYTVTKQTKNTNKTSPVIKTPKAIDLSEPSEPERILSQTYRIIRDTEIARWVKYIHEYKCQICGTAIQLCNGQLYAEAHHVKPLGGPHHGPDVVENIICVCPNHHAQLDYAAIELNKSKLISVPGHNISDEYVNYHNMIVLTKRAG